MDSGVFRVLDCVLDLIALRCIESENLVPHEIHVSERRSFRGCRRRWDWHFRQGYSPTEVAKPLEFGIAYHIGKEAFFDPETWNTTTAEEKMNKAIDTFKAECERQRARYLMATNQQGLDDAAGDDYDSRIDLGQGMFWYYATYVHPEFDSWFKPVATEIAFEVPIPDPDSDTPDSILRCTESPFCGQEHSNDPNDEDSQVVYAGRVDLLVEDLRYGGYYIWDHKTARVLANDDGFLQLDDQIASYCWALATILNLDIRGFIYAESRKDYPKPPPLLKRPYRGCIYSTSKTLATHIDVYEPVVKEGDPIAYRDGLYNEYLAYLKSTEATKFHQRFVIRKSTAELQEVGRNISLEAADMVAGSLRVYPSVGKFSCSGCAFREPCVSMNAKEDYLYNLNTNFRQSTQRYYHTKQPTSDKKS